MKLQSKDRGFAALKGLQCEAHGFRPFEADRAFELTRSLCFPRGVGTQGEDRAARQIAGEFGAAGLTVERQTFPISPFVAGLISRLLLAAAAAVVVAAAMIATSQPLLSCIGWLAAIFLLNRSWRIAAAISTLFPSRLLSRNLIARLPELADAAAARVIFMAHYDTKSQYLPTGIRVAFVSAATVICGSLVALGIAAGLGYPEWLQAVDPMGASTTTAVLIAALAANFSGNRSPGALDNGSGVGALLELARCWRPTAATPIEVIWVASGSEELGLNGARHFLNTHGHLWQEEPTLLINLESVGAGSRVYLAGQSDALALAESVAQELEMPYAELHVLGAGMDHEPFAAKNLAAVSILGDVVRNSLAMHSGRDNMNLIDREAIARAGLLASEMARTWAASHSSFVKVFVPTSAGEAIAGIPEGAL